MIMLKNNIRLAFASVRGAKWRSFLTMLGVIIGIVSVVTIFSLGEGIRRQVADIKNQFGGDLIVVQPGRKVVNDNEVYKSITAITSPLQGSLTQKDLDSINQAAAGATVVPLTRVGATPRINDSNYSAGQVYGTDEKLPLVLNHKILFGSFFKATDLNKNSAVIGMTVAEELFGETVPVGRSLQIGDQSFIVRGVFEDFVSSPLLPEQDYNTAIFIPLVAAQKLNGDQSNIRLVYVKPGDHPTATVISSLQDKLRQNYAGQDDFSVMTQAQNLAQTDAFIAALTGIISAIAAISLLVGGIGIMNTLLVTVSERTREIGIRKAIGATNRQIVSQFLTESIIISLLGGIIGIAISGIVNYVIRITTDLTPVISLEVIGLTSAVIILIGVIFGVTPAVRAARKDPIVALRGY